MPHGLDGWLNTVRAVLDASVWKTAALSVAAGLILYGNAKRWFPVVFDAWIIEILIVAGVVCACLSLTTLIPNTFSLMKRADVWNVRRAKRLVADSIPQLSSKEREIISYLLHQNQRMFETTPDAGYASTLVSKGIVVCAVRPGQQVRGYGVPFEVPKHVWDALVAHKAEFADDLPGQSPAFPWAIPWQLR
jgi:Super-infection exclusion protein B